MDDYSYIGDYLYIESSYIEVFLCRQSPKLKISHLTFRKEQ